MPEQPSQANLIALGGGGVAFLASFLPFAKGVSDGFSEESSTNAWADGLLTVASIAPLVALVAGVILAVRVFGWFELPTSLLGFTIPQVVVALGGYAAVHSVLMLVWSPPFIEFGVGFYLVLLASIALLAGSVMSLREEPGGATDAPPQVF